VEVLGEQAGWLALQAGIAVGADVVLIPEVPRISPRCGELKDKVTAQRPWGWWWWRKAPRSSAGERRDEAEHAEGVSVAARDGEASDHVIRKSGQAAGAVAAALQLQLAEETFRSSWAPG